MGIIKDNIEPIFDLIYTQLKNNSTLSDVSISQFTEQPRSQQKIPSVNVIPYLNDISSELTGNTRLHFCTFKVECINRIRDGSELITLIDNVYYTLKELRTNSSFSKLSRDLKITDIAFAYSTLKNVLLGKGEFSIIAEIEELV